MKQVELEAELTRLLEQERAPEALVGALREHMPDANDLGSLASRLALQGVPLTPSPPVAMSGAGKAWLGLAAGALTVAGAWLLLRGEPAPSSIAPSNGAPVVSVTEALPAAPLPSAATAPRSAAREPASAERSAPDVTTPTPSAPAVTSETSETSETIAAAPSAGAPKLAAAPPTPAPVAAEQPRAAPPIAPRTGVPAVTGGSESAFADPGAPADQPSEIELLREARLSLRSSPARALELSEQHARSYPAGKLVQERELLAITALVSLGRRTAALSRAARFEQNFPTSPYRKQLGELLQ